MTIMSARVGCNVGGMFVNILAYADDVVLLAPSWWAMQYLINLLAKCADRIDICLLYTSPSPRDRQKSRMPSSA